MRESDNKNAKKGFSLGNGFDDLSKPILFCYLSWWQLLAMFMVETSHPYQQLKDNDRNIEYQMHLDKILSLSLQCPWQISIAQIYPVIVIINVIECNIIIIQNTL